MDRLSYRVVRIRIYRLCSCLYYLPLIDQVRLLLLWVAQRPQITADTLHNGSIKFVSIREHDTLCPALTTLMLVTDAALTGTHADIYGADQRSRHP